MIVTQPLNELAKLALIASDTSYFTSTNTVPLGGVLAPFRDTPTYDILPLYTIAPGFVKDSDDARSRNDAVGFKFTAYQNTATNEIIVAFGGTDGPDPVDWTSNTQLGWNQWENSRDLVFDYLRPIVNAGTKVHFSGQSLGGALAQYAAYEWVQKKLTITDPLDPEFLADFNKQNFSLTTFNGLGGLKGLTDHVGYDPTVLQGLGLSGHFYVTNDMVSRFGDGHVGGETFLLDFRSDRTNDLGQQYAYGLVDAHRIETGFYANLRPGALLEFQVSPGTSPIAYLNVDSAQEYAALLGNLLNNKELGLVESRFRLVAAVTAGLTIGSPSSVNAVTQALLTSLHDSGDLSDSWFQTFSAVNWGAIFIPTRPVMGTISILSTLGAIFTDAVQGTASGISTIFQSMSEYISAGSRPNVTVTPPTAIDVPSRQLQFEVLMASMGAAPHLTELMTSLPSGLDPEALAAQMLSGGAEWLPNTLAFARTHANTAGQTPAELAEMTTQLVTALNHRIDVLQDVSLEEKNQLVAQLNAFTQDTASGFANALPDFTQKIVDVAFNLGQAISNFADIRLIDQAYAAELNDPRLSSSARTVIEDARETFQHAGQTVVIRTGMGPNPFHTPGFVPGGSSSATLEERLGEMFRLSLPFAARVGGQRVLLQVQGGQSNRLTVSTSNGVQSLDGNSTFELIVPEGDDQLYFSLVANDEVSDDSTVTLSAVLVGADGQPTHRPQLENTINVKAFVGTGNDGYEIWMEDLSNVPLENYPPEGEALPIGAGGFLHQTLIGGPGPDDLNYWQGFGDDILYGNGGNDWLSGGYGHDRLYGGDGDDRLLADPYDYHPDPIPRPSLLLPPPTLDGKDYADGGEGNDRIGGGGNDDRLIGGAGNDEIWGDALTRGTYIDNPDGSQIFVSLTGVLVPGDDVLEGGDGDDYLSGDGGDDILDGGAGNDLLIGDTQQGVVVLTPMAAGDDFLSGGAGNDELQGNAGHDVLLGGAGDDRLYGDDDASQAGDDWLEGGSGDDFLTGFDGDDTLAGGDGADVLFAGTGDDSLLGGDGDDIGFGGEGDDDISAGAGADQFDGEVGNDVLFGDEGDDLLIGGDGLDEIDGGMGNDLLLGGAGDDTLFGRDGNDELQGNAGNDLLVGEEGDDQLFGQEGDDELFGGNGNDSLRGDNGDDLIDGGAGDDILVGDADGQIGGSGGNDILVGGNGNDTLVGGGGQDTYLYGMGDGFDVIVEGVGENNRLVFGSGISPNAIIAAVGLNDSLVIRTGNGENAVEIENFGTNNLAGPHPIDSFQFSDGSILTYGQLAVGGLAVSGGLGNDQLIGTDQGERVFGGAGNDSINAGAGNDVLLGGAGNDALFGESGQDTYVFTLGGGIDQIQDAPSEGNRLAFGSGISQANFSLGFRQTTIPGEGGEGEGEGGNPGRVLNYLVVRTGGIGDAVEIQWFDPANQLASLGVDQFVFADGTILTSSQLLADGLELVGTAGFDTLDGRDIYRRIRGLAGDDVLIGGAIDNVLVGDDGRDVLIANGGNDQLSGGTGDDVLRGGEGNDVLVGEVGNDSLEGESGDDVLVGGIGDDQLNGGEGNDTYHFNLGDGFDSVFDSGSDADTDTVLFGSGVTSDYVSLSSQFGQILIKVGTGSDGILSGSTFDVFGSQTIEQFQFADGSTLTYADLVARGFAIDGTEFDDVLSGTDLVDRFRGGIGNDRLEGGEGNDSYVFNIGDGVDRIADIASAGTGNEVVFGSGITASDLHLDLVADESNLTVSDLLLRVGTNGDAIQLDTFDRTNLSGPRTVETVRFADGSVLTYEQLLARGFDLSGTNGDDHIAGTSTVDRIMAGAGDDVLQGGGGDDQLDGGAGHDRLIGGQGNDTYLFGPGSGRDTIVEVHGTRDVIRIMPGVAPSDVVVTRQNNDLVLRLNGGADQLTISLYFLAVPLQIEQIQFADGTVWDASAIQERLRPTITGTADNDTLVGTAEDDRLLGLTGDDQLAGLAGNDELDGGSGIDQLTGGAGDDQYVVDDPGDSITELTNEGVDTVLSSVTRALEANVENLTLTGVSPINGMGNALDNVLTGNRAANLLAGGLGDDTFVVGADDTVIELVNEGTDTVQTGSDATLGAHIENLTLTGSASLIGTGNVLDNVLRADGSISVLAGGDGNDTYLTGPNGDEDILVETPNGGIDTVIAARDYHLPDNIERLTLLDPRIPDFATFSLAPYHLSAESIAGYGNELSNTLIGGRANNVLDGGRGADTLVGGAGDDVYIVDDVDDVVVEQPDEGVDSVESTASYTLSEHVENLSLLGTSAINATGNALNNHLQGNEASNVLDGGASHDALVGLGGADVYLFGRGSGRDTVFDSGTADEIDTIQFDSTVTVEGVEVYRNGFNLELAIRGTTDGLTLLSFFASSGYDQKQVRFADGTLWTGAQLSARAVVGTTITGTIESETLSGGDGHDLLIGSAGNDVLMGGQGNDTLYGDNTFQSLFGPQVIGDDTLIGGAGNDTLFDFRGANLFDGGAGDDTLVLGTGVDTVLFGRGSGLDRVSLDGGRNNIDVIHMAADILPAEVVLTWHSSSVADILISDSGDRLTIQLSTDWFAVGPETTQARVRFVDGTEWSLAWSSSNVDVPAATPGDDVLSAAFPGTLAGLGGNDTYLFGSSGVAGNYAVVEAEGDGIDTVQSLLDYVLDPHVENLILAESTSSVLPSPESGIGNDLDNLLVGNSRDNVLAGGAGHDVLVGGVFRSVEDFFVLVTGSDILIGGAGDDVMMADGGNIVFALDGGNGSWLFLDGGVELREDVPRLADDLFIGGIGNDTYIVHSQHQIIAEFEGEGIDTVKSTVSYVLGDHLENLKLVSSPDGFDDEDNVLPSLPLDGTGNELDNVLIGSEDADVLSGLAGRDTLTGRGGFDTLRGGTGHDTYFFNRGDGVDTIEDVASFGEGNRIQFGSGITSGDLTFVHDEPGHTLTIHVGGEADQLVLTNFDLSGINGSLVVETVALSDGSQLSLAGLLGPTITIFGTDSNDVAVGTAGDDGIDAGTGDDTVYGNAGNDLILAGAGVDSVMGDEGADAIFGGNGTDYLYGGEGDDVIDGEEGHDVVVGDAGNDALSGGEGNDTLNGGAGADQLFGGEGDDTLYIDAMDTNVSGGPGYDVVSVAGSEAVMLNATTAEVEYVAGSNGNDVFTAVDGAANVTFYGGDGDDHLIGGDGNDVLVGQTGADRVMGGLGNDVLNGGDGDDSLSGGTGNDTVYGGTGSDWVSGGDGEDSVSGEDGADTIFGGNGTDYLYGGEGDDVIDGEEGHDVVVGDAGNDALSGGEGNDTLNGGAGADQLFGGEGDDTLYIDAMDTNVSGGPGYDVVSVAGSEAVMLNATTAEVEYVAGSNGNDVFTAVDGAANVTFYGGDGDDHLIGGDGNDVLVGQTGADRVMGGLGNDVLNGGDGDDSLSGGTGNDTVYGGTGSDWVSGGDGEDSVSGEDGADTIFGGNGADYLSGGDGDDALNGDEGNDTLVGRTGQDTLIGGVGNDYLVGGTGNDEYLFTRGDGVDTISESDTTAGNHDRLGFGPTIDSLDLILSRQANDLRVAIHGTNDQVSIENWYLGEAHQVEAIQTESGQALFNSQVEQLIHAMAAFTEQTGLTWDQAIDQRRQDVQAVLAASWQ